MKLILVFVAFLVAITVESDQYSLLVWTVQYYMFPFSIICFRSVSDVLHLRYLFSTYLVISFNLYTKFPVHGSWSSAYLIVFIELYLVIHAFKSFLSQICKRTIYKNNFTCLNCFCEEFAPSRVKMRLLKQTIRRKFFTSSNLGPSNFLSVPTSDFH